MKLSRIIKLVVCDLVVLTTVLMAFEPWSSNGGVLAHADDFDASSDSQTYPYDQTFIITSYYSPLPCQDHYATGSYNGDISLNGHGIHGADGTNVYPGMIAAPKTYTFGTKLYIPNVGIVAIHDRGGAIVKANQRGNSYDRLDIWMGYGDKGLDRALAWGKRTVNVTVYGVTDSVTEDVSLPGFSSDEYVPNECDSSDQNVTTSSNSSSSTSTTSTSSTAEQPKDEMTQLAEKYNLELAELLSQGLEPGDSGTAVRNLQNELRNLNFYRKETTGVYDKVTEHAVFKFQQAKGIVATINETGAGVFGPKTRQEMNEMISARNSRQVLIAQATTEGGFDLSSIAKANDTDTSKLIVAELDLGATGQDVKDLQNLLKTKGYYDDSVTGYFGESTKDALIKFQKDNGVISDEADNGAGRVGPNTLKLINSMS